MDDCMTSAADLMHDNIEPCSSVTSHSSLKFLVVERGVDQGNDWTEDEGHQIIPNESIKPTPLVGPFAFVYYRQ